MNQKPLIYDLTLEQINSLLQDWGEPSFRAGQIWHGLYRQLVSSPEAITSLPVSLRLRLMASYRFQSLKPKAIAQSQDLLSEKVLFELPDGHAVEAVLMRYERRRTICISTQVGCAMECVFCATGQMGFKRHLSSGEIVEQALYFARKLSEEQDHLTNIVFMGMGEPFHNYDASLAAVDRLNDHQGFCFGARRITLSTVGLVPEIERFTQEKRQVNLAISLHAATNELRSRLLPINRRYPLEVLIPACRKYIEITGRRIIFEWAMMKDINDGRDQANALADLINGLNCHVNLIPLNPTPKFIQKAASRIRIEAFVRILEDHGISCTIRLRRGIDIQAGCGQLAIKNNASNDISS